VTLEAVNGAGAWSWDFSVTRTEGRTITALLDERVTGGAAGARVGLMRRVVLDPAGAVLEACGEVLAAAACDEPPPRVTGVPALSTARAPRGGTVVRSLVVRRTQPGTTVQVYCLGGGCRDRVSGTFRDRRGTTTLSLNRRARGMTLRPGAELRVVVARPGHQGRVYRYTMRRDRPPKRVLRCQAPGAAVTTRC
jgi:hypothetical protein